MRGRSVTVGALLLLASCSTDAADPGTTAAEPTTTSTGATTTTTATPTTTEAETTTTTVAGEQPVGDPALLAEEFDATAADVALLYEDYTSDPLPVPDFSDPDPIQALYAILEWDELMAETYPIAEFARVYTVEGSPAERSFGGTLDRLFVDGQVIVNETDPAYELTNLAIYRLESDQDFFDDAALAEAPEDSIIVLFDEVLSVGHFVDRQTKDVAQSFPEQRFKGGAVMTPTDGGWKIWRYKLEEVS